MSDPLKDLRKRQRFILDDDDLIMLGELAKPRFLTLQDQRTPQELSNEAWMMLGAKHGFVWDSVIADAGTKDRGVIKAIPTDLNRVDIPLPSNDLGEGA